MSHYYGDPENERVFIYDNNDAAEYIRADLVPQWQPSDGRPCSMDVFVSKLFETCYDRQDRCDAINEWLHGDWDAAFCYLQDEDAEALRERGYAVTAPHPTARQST